MTRIHLLLAAFGASLALAAPASAATLTNAGGTLTYTGTDVVNDVTFTRTAANEVQVVRNTTDDADPISASGCTENTAGEDYTCTGVNTLVVDGAGENDDLDASAVSDIPVTMNGGAGDDDLDTGDAADVMSGGAGDDDLVTAGGADKLDGGDGADFLDGEAEGDELNGGSGGDIALGGASDDVVNGGTGDDVVLGDSGNDRLSGEAGDDRLFGDDDNDDITGGDGYDEANGSLSMGPRTDMTVTLDDQPNDSLSGGTGEADNVHSDVEAVNAEPNVVGGLVPPSGNDTLIGNAAPNSLSGDRGNDTIEGGTNNDSLTGGDGDDTIRARDGYADFVNCGAGGDTAEVDSLDTVQECETVNLLDVGNANEDRPPAIELTGPAAGALLRTTAPTTMTANATDDRGVAQVLFLDDDRIVCADTAAPYTCPYAPRGEDVGRNTLVATAVDTAQQTATTTRTFRVDRFSATITGSVTPGRDTRAPFRFVTRGRLRFPAAVPASLGCGDGVVSVQVKAGGRTISNRRARVRQDCRFASVVTFGSRRRFTRSGALRFTLRFTGNEVLKRSLAVARNVRTRRAVG